MTLWSRVRSWLGALVNRSRREGDMDAELRFYLDSHAEDLIRTGLSKDEAYRVARLRVGGIENLKEQCRDERGARWVENLWQDLRFALRTLRKNPGFTVLTILTLALGIGANTAIFSIVDSVLLRSLAYRDADQLVVMFNVPLKRQDALSSISYRDFKACREQNHVFSELAGNAFHDLALTGAGEPSIVNTAAVTPEIFSVLNAEPLAGRALIPDDGKQGAAPVAVLSENLWRNRFGSNQALIGQTIALDMRLFTVVGILPASFRFPEGAARQDVWIAVEQDPLFGPLTSQPGSRVLGGIARMKPGVSLAQAQAEMNILAAQFAKEFPREDEELTFRVIPYRQFVVGGVKSPLLILLGAVGLVLLIACANIANLLLSRGSSRAREIALRIALGAGRGRIVRQLLTESALLALLGGAAGVLLAAWGVWVLQPLLPPDLTQINSIHVGGSVLAFALLSSFIAALLFGLAPALLTRPSKLQTSIQESDRTGQRGGGRVRSFLVIAEISLATVLAVAGGLLIRSFALVTSVHPGFNPENVIEAEISLPRFEYSTPQQWTIFSEELLKRLHAQPGLSDSAMAAPLPMDRQGAASLGFSIVGDAPLPPSKSATADYSTVSPDYFRVMRIPLLRGRRFSERDSPSNPKVAIVSETLARRYFEGRDPIGKKLKFGFPPNSDVSREIVGVVGDVRDVALGQKPGPMMYVPFAQAPLWGGEIVARSSLSAPSVAAGIREAVGSIDKNLPVTDVEPLADALGQSISQERFRMFVLASFSAMALILAAIGIFGVISYSVSRRTREIGIRMALGAESNSVLRMVLSQGLRLILPGVALGLCASVILTRIMKTMLYGITPFDPLTFGIVTAVLISVALAACWIPARRATQLDPVATLRCE
jgi:putative ABC transport system permease protein